MLPAVAVGQAVHHTRPLIPVRPLRDVISAEAVLAGLLERRQRELAVLNRLQKLLPPALAAQISIADASRPELLLSTLTGAAATLARHRAPEILERLTREGWKFTGIRVRVQARPASLDTSKVYAKQMDKISAGALRDGAGRIRDPQLAAALRRLADHGTAGSEDQHKPFEGIENQHAKQEK